MQVRIGSAIEQQYCHFAAAQRCAVPERITLRVRSPVAFARGDRFVGIEAAVEQERLEAWIIDEVRSGLPLPGLYPANAETKARYAAFRAAQDK